MGNLSETMRQLMCSEWDIKKVEIVIKFVTVTYSFTKESIQRGISVIFFVYFIYHYQLLEQERRN